MLSYGHQSINDDDIQAVVDVLKSDFLTQGPVLEKFEKEICKVTGAKFCVAVCNATAALHIAVAALDLPSGSEGITTPNTFLASANCLVYNNVKPVFADIDARTYNINPSEIQKHITPQTKVLVPVHFAGLPCDMSEIKKIADEHNCYVIEDACHAIASVYDDGTPVGNCKYSDMTVFSFHPVKTITTGEGGAITTNNETLYKKLLMLRSHGMTKDGSLLSKNPGSWYYEMQMLGFNYRMTEIQAALGVSQLKRLEEFKKRRREIVASYNEAFSSSEFIKTPYEPKNLSSCFHLYVIQIDFEKLRKSRKQVMQELAEKGVGTQVLYIPVANQPYYKKNFGYKEGDFPVVEAYYEKALALPLFPAMTDDDVCTVIKAVGAVVRV